MRWQRGWGKLKIDEATGLLSTVNLGSIRSTKSISLPSFVDGNKHFETRDMVQVLVLAWVRSRDGSPPPILHLPWEFGHIHPKYKIKWDYLDVGIIFRRLFLGKLHFLLNSVDKDPRCFFLDQNNVERTNILNNAWKRSGRIYSPLL